MSQYHQDLIGLLVSTPMRCATASQWRPESRWWSPCTNIFKAVHERDGQRMAWRVGMMNYGYHKEVRQVQARLVMSEDRMAPVGSSEAEVIRRIYRLAGDEQPA